MGLIRLVIFALVIWMVWRLIRNYQAGQNSKNRNSGNKNKLASSTMVACRYCKVHVPDNTAIAHDDLWFCSESHKAKFIAENS